MVLKNIKKGQGLPLNTIVIAILVVIVLLVIVVFFITNITRSDDGIRNVNNNCKLENPIISTAGYEDVRPERFDPDFDDNKCAGDYRRITVVYPWDTDNDGEADQMCCGYKPSNN